MTKLTHSLIIIIFLYSIPSFSKDYVLNFEASCFESYGQDQRNEIINAAISNWNSIESSPKIVIRGEDIAVEVDENNYFDYIWDPTNIPFSGTDIFNIPDNNLNPVICDSTGDLLTQMLLDSADFNVKGVIHGFTSREFLPFYDFFYIYISENHGLATPDISDFTLTNGADLIIEGGRFSINQMISLLTHEIGHALGLGHVNIDRTTPLPSLIEPENDYPIMWYNNFNSTTYLEAEDIEEFNRVVKFSYLGKHNEVSFEAKIRQVDQDQFIQNGSFNLAHGQLTTITLKINIPPELRDQNMEFLVAAKIQSTGKWYTYSQALGWIPWSDNLASNAIVSSIENEMVVFNNLWSLNQDVELYFGIRIGSEIFFNKDIPMLIK